MIELALTSEAAVVTCCCCCALLLLLVVAGGAGAFAVLNSSEDALWGVGLNESVNQLREALGPSGVVIGNYGTANVPSLNGRMIERGGSGDNTIKALQDLSASHPGQVVEYHAQYADRSSGTFNNTLATFLLGMGPGAYYGKGNGWGGPGIDACAAWLVTPPEYFKPLGEAAGLATRAADGTWSREFASGTRVFLQGTKPGQPARETKSCIHWADKTQTGTACADQGFVRGGYAGLGLAGPQYDAYKPSK
eukprot:COSAG06_NODE_4606_length_4106_cov_7.039681_2_plen_250_part_00